MTKIVELNERARDTLIFNRWMDNSCAISEIEERMLWNCEIKKC